MTGSIILTEDNLSPDGVFNSSRVLAPFNRLTLNMRGLNLQGRRIGLKKLNLYYSWPNIRNATSITISWRIAGVYSNYTWTLPALTNYSSISVLNQALQTFCIANGLYLIDSNGDNVYYVSLAANSTSYKVDLSLYTVPTSLPVGYTQPSNFAGYPTASITPKMIIPASSEFSGITGLSAGTYDGVGSNIVYSSTYVPQLSPVSTVFITCNIAKNDVPINGSTVIQAFTTRGTDYGAMIEIAPSEVAYYEVDSNSNNLEIQLFDQSFGALYVQDPQITVHLEVA